MFGEISREFFKLKGDFQQSSKIKVNLRCAVWNVCSMNNKLPNIMEHILDCNSDIVFLTETWLQTDKNPITAEIKTYGYTLLHDRRKDRQKDRGGGVGILVKSNVSTKQLKVKAYVSFEHTIVQIQLCNRKLLFVISVYRLQEVAAATFFEEFTELLDSYALSNEFFIIAGDTNIHMDTETNVANQMKDLLDSYNLMQHIDCATHIKGHTLDLVITPKNVSIQDVCVKNIDLSHHFLISFNSHLMLETRK